MNDFDDKKQVLRHTARKAVLQLILDGELKPGERIPQERIAKKLAISRGVLRESLLDLQSTYLVQLIDHKGAFVGRLDEEKISEIYVAREAIECMVVRLCCVQVNRLQIEELKDIVEKECEFAGTGDTERAARMDMLYHRHLLEFCGNKILAKIMEEYLILAKIFRTKLGDPMITCDDHRQINSAIEANDADRAEEIMRTHIRIGLGHAVRQIRQDPASTPLMPIEAAAAR